jgi:hypothetical protein
MRLTDKGRKGLGAIADLNADEQNEGRVGAYSGGR